jgi:hypothetical protein
LRDSVDLAPELGEPLRPLTEPTDDLDAPLVADAVEDLANRDATITLVTR